MCSRIHFDADIILREVITALYREESERESERAPERLHINIVLDKCDAIKAASSKRALLL